MHARKSITKTFIAPALLLVIGLILAACQPASQSSQGQQIPATGATATVAAPAAAPTATTASSSSAQSAPSQVNLTTRTDAKLGKYLADEKGMTLYIYTKDSPGGKSVCEGKCLQAWPALLIAKSGTIQLDGKTDSNFGTITRSDGSTQVAYKNMPLYYWVKDQKPGDTTGQGVGKVWFVVNPETGEFTGAPASSGGSSSGSSTPAAVTQTPSASSGAGNGSAATAPSQVNLTTRTDDKLCKYLADEKGMTLYIYTKDSPGTSVCEGKCLAAWPALSIAKGGTIQLDGKMDSNFGTITRSDGSIQVAYKNMPLYYWMKDQKPGDTTGQGVGNVWFVVNPETGQFTGAPASSSSMGSSMAAAPASVNLTVRTDPKLGKYLADDKGMTLYIYTKDTPGKSVCEGQCLVNWPALMVAKGGKAEVQGMDEGSKLSTITRSDGSTQVAFNGMPLYYFIKDKQPGDVTGQGVGGVWFVVAP